MAKKPMPTDSELAILNVLWTRGPSTVREVHEELQDAQGTGYTSTLKLMQLMAQKGLVDRDESRRSHVYSARPGEEATKKSLVRQLADKAFDGSAAQLAMRALSAKKASPEELAEIRRLLDEMEKRNR